MFWGFHCIERTCFPGLALPNRPIAEGRALDDQEQGRTGLNTFCICVQLLFNSLKSYNGIPQPCSGPPSCKLLGSNVSVSGRLASSFILYMCPIPLALPSCPHNIDHLLTNYMNCVVYFLYHHPLVCHTNTPPQTHATMTAHGQGRYLVWSLRDPRQQSTAWHTGGAQNLFSK